MDEKACILFVDDEKDFADAMAKLLRSEGYYVEIAFSGSEALDIYQSRDFDLVITDLKMPIMDGIELIRHLRQINSDQPIIVVTAFPAQCMPWNRRLATEQELQDTPTKVDYLAKPFPSRRLIETVEKSLAEATSLRGSLPQETAPEPSKPEYRPSEAVECKTPPVKQPWLSQEVPPSVLIKKILEDAAKAIGERVSCAVLGEDGIAIAQVNQAGFFKISGRFTVMMKLSSETLADAGGGHLSESLLGSDEEWVLTRFIEQGHCYLCIVTNLKVPLGTLRTVANKTVEKLSEIL